MWWKIAIAVVCAAVLVSPVDLSTAHIGVDDVVSIGGLIASIIAMITAKRAEIKSKHCVHEEETEGQYVDVDNN